MAQELQVDLFYFLGHVFFLSILVLLGLIMVTHLGPGQESGPGPRQVQLCSYTSVNTKRRIFKYDQSDGEGTIKSMRRSVEELGTQLNVLGHGSHTPHAEAAMFGM